MLSVRTSSALLVLLLAPVRLLFRMKYDAHSPKNRSKHTSFTTRLGGGAPGAIGAMTAAPCPLTFIGSAAAIPQVAAPLIDVRGQYCTAAASLTRLRLRC